MSNDYINERRKAWFAFKKENENSGITLSIRSFMAGYDAGAKVTFCDCFRSTQYHTDEGWFCCTCKKAINDLTF